MNEDIETKLLLSKLVGMVSLLIPEKFSIAFLAESTGKSRQAITQYIYNHYTPETDYWKVGKKLFVRKEIGLELLERYKTQLAIAT